MSDPVIKCNVFIAGSGPIGAAYARKVLEEHPTATVYMAEIGSQDNPVIGAHHKNAVKYQKDIDAFVHVIQGALQPISVPPQSSFMSTLGEVAWTPPTDKPLVQSYHNPNQKAEENLESFVTRTVGGMATHWTCACPVPHAEESAEITKVIPRNEFNGLLEKSKTMLGVNLGEFDGSIRHNLVKDTLAKAYGKERVKNLPLAVKRNEANPEYVTWSGVDTVLGGFQHAKSADGKPRFTLGTEIRVTRLVRDDIPGSRVITGCLVRNLKEHKDYLVRADKYVIACGAVATPQVLFNSKIRPSALGRYLTEQSLTFCQIVLKRSIIDTVKTKYPAQFKKHSETNKNDPLPIPFNDPEPQVTMPYASNTPYHTQIHRDAFAYGGVGPKADPRVVVDLRFFGKQDINPENCVTFSEVNTDSDESMANKDGYGMPQATFHVKRSTDDHERDHSMMKDMCEAANHLGAFLPGSEPQFMKPGLVLHITGTTRIGKDPKTSVADANSLVHGYDNLYVGGNGCLPDSTACNPTLTSVAFAIKGAEHMIGTLPK